MDRWVTLRGGGGGGGWGGGGVGRGDIFSAYFSVSYLGIFLYYLIDISAQILSQDF